MAVDFYNQGDQEIHEGGQFYIPQERYRLGKFNNTVAPMPMDGTQQVTQEFGIPYTGAFTNAGGGGGGGPLNEYGIDTSEGNMKRFYDQNVWDGSSWVNKTVKGYWDPNLNTYKTAQGKNIKHGGHFTGDPKKGDIEGEDFQFPSIAGGIIQWLKNKAQGATKKIGGAFAGGKDETITGGNNQEIIDQMQINNATQPTSTGGMTYNQIVDNMVQDRNPNMRDRPGGEGGKELMAQGGRIGFFQGALADTAEGHAMSPGTSATGEFRGGQGDGGQGGGGGGGDGGNNTTVTNTTTLPEYGYNWKNIFPGGKPFYGPLNVEEEEEPEGLSPTLGSHLLHKDATARQIEKDAAMAALIAENPDQLKAQGGRVGFFQGALADTAEGQAMSPGTSATGEFRGGDGGQGDGNNFTSTDSSTIPIKQIAINEIMKKGSAQGGILGSVMGNIPQMMALKGMYDLFNKQRNDPKVNEEELIYGLKYGGLAGLL